MNGESTDRIHNRLKSLATPAVIAYWLLIFVATHIPNPEDLPAPDVSDKLLHFSAYFVLYGLLSLRHRVLGLAWPNSTQQARMLLVTVTYAAVDELLQKLPMVNRNADWLDGVADCGGLLTAAAITWLIHSATKNRSEDSDSE
ncbi:MAG: VanZ family protein [Planctomycetes bacterium]|nr:VanZ family protein [Planctomycetota bacterium]